MHRRRTTTLPSSKVATTACLRLSRFGFCLICSGRPSLLVAEGCDAGHDAEREGDWRRECPRRARHEPLHRHAPPQPPIHTRYDWCLERRTSPICLRSFFLFVLVLVSLSLVLTHSRCLVQCGRCDGADPGRARGQRAAHLRRQPTRLDRGWRTSRGGITD